MSARCKGVFRRTNYSLLMIIILVYISECFIVFFVRYKNSWWSDTCGMQVCSDDYEIEGIWCGFFHGTFCTSTRVSEKCLNLEVEQTVSKQEVRPLRTQVEQEAKHEATSVLEADSDDDQWGSWGPRPANQ